MPAITLQIMLTPSTHVLRDDAKQALRHKRGDVFDVLDTDRLAHLADGVYRSREPIGSPRFGFLHVLRVPPPVASNARQALRRRVMRSVFVDDPSVPGGYTENQAIRRSAYLISIGGLPAAVQGDLSALKEATIAWPALLAALRRKQVIVHNDSRRDVELDRLTDDDIANG